MPRLLILSFYFPPDLSAGSFRCQALVDAIERLRPPKMEVELVTTLPNRYHQMNNQAAEYEDRGWLKIRRIKLPKHESGMIDQSRSFGVFSMRAMAATKGKRYDAVFATSSRLMTAALGALIAKRADSPLYLDIRDLFVDTMGDVFAQSAARYSLPLFGHIEKRTFSAAARMSIVSAGFESYISQFVPKDRLRIYTNGIDAEFLHADYSHSTGLKDRRPVILYAGNIGEGQGLEHIIPQAARKLENKAQFRIVGSGGRLPQLAAAVSSLPNVELCPPVDRTKLLDHYRQADMLLLHLNDHEAFKRVLPSKLFEYAATGKVMLAGVAGHAADFIASNVDGAIVFQPCSVVGLVDAVVSAQTGPSTFPRDEFRAKFSRQRIMEEMALDLIGFSQTKDRETSQ